MIVLINGEQKLVARPHGYDLDNSVILSITESGITKSIVLNNDQMMSLANYLDHSIIFDDDRVEKIIV